MAKIEFIGFVEDWSKASTEHPSWGMKVVETHSKKDGESWKTIGRTFRKLKPGYIDNEKIAIDFTQYAKGDRLKIRGTEVTEAREYSGKTYYDLVVKVESIELLSRSTQAQTVSTNVSNNSWDFKDDGSAPF